MVTQGGWVSFNIYRTTLILAAGFSQNYTKLELFPTTFYPL